MKDCMTIILAGGKGSRLDPLTRDRAKPAVPFGGQYRIVDFALSNCLNSGLRKILLLTQYKCMSLDRHIQLAWQQYFCRELGEFIDLAPPQHRVDESWYRGTADAVYQNIYSLEQERPKHVVILAGDHIYKMNYAKMVEFHKASEAQLTIGALPVPRAEASQFGVMEIDSESRIVGFDEKPAEPKTIPGDDNRSLASMGIYVFNADVLFNKLCSDAACETSHDFGKDIIPAMIDVGDPVYACPFRDENQESDPYWRDVGTLDAYYQACMDLISVEPQLNVYDYEWPIRSYTQPSLPPPKFIFNGQEDPNRRGMAIDSIVGQGSIISGGQVEHCVLGRNVRVNSYSVVRDSIFFDDVDVGRGCRIRRAIVEKHVSIPPNTELGFDPEYDRARGFHVTESGIVVVAPGDSFIPESHRNGHATACM